ncbi:ASPIC and UnbV protein [Paenibacillus dendritiformis]|uniref:CRTAC1 family protein n=1 Tax=Paenibacillus dendritiformis TaxID=130049 RepID=UPI0018CD6580|nr:CRTAC1 family protein [Paenibacillus dendritiformis]MBG9794372.1 ASPIC and UnbV protein [Paenibacillus dendritiformis]
MLKIVKKWCIPFSIILLAGCAVGEPVTIIDRGFRYEEISVSSGIEFTHQTETFDSKLSNIMPWMSSTGAAVAVADYNGDGYMDLYYTNSQRNSKNKLFRNNGDGTFTEVAEEAAVADVNQEGISETALWLDIDNSGNPSLFVGAWGKSHLYKNNGDGTFTDITDSSGTGYIGYVSKAIALDYNRDGYLDIYLSCYFNEQHDLWNLDTTKIMHNDFERARNGGRNVLLRNNGDNTFTDVSKEMNVDDPGWTLASGVADLNGDGWPDIYNANDFGPDTLLINQEGKGFKPLVQKRGIGDDTFKGMNVDFADLFHDGRLANFVSNISKEQYLLEGNQLWHEDEQGKYVDRAQELGVQQSGWSWGARFFDADNSGNMSLMVTNGFISADKDEDYWFDMGTLATTPGYIVEDAASWPAFKNKSMSGYEPKPLYLNDGKKFVDVSKDVGITFTDDSRGVAAVDLFNRGVNDLVFANQGSPTKVYKNEMTNGNHWIKLDLVGTFPSNRDAVGARVTFEVGGVKTVIEKDGGNSHGAQSDPRIHFGLGQQKAVDKITINWPSGRTQTLENVEGDKILRIGEPEYE